MGLNHDWGYSIRHFFALKKSYGTCAEFKQLVDECHQRQIRVFMDAVFNHTASDCPLQIIDPQYWVRLLSVDLISTKLCILVLQRKTSSRRYVFSSHLAFEDISSMSCRSILLGS